MNYVMIEQIKFLSEKKTMFQKTKKYISNWKSVAFVTTAILTVKVMAEQLAMIFIRGAH